MLSRSKVNSDFNLYSDLREVPLTKRQLECLSLLAQTPSIKKIAKMLDLSARTVEMHLKAIRSKTGIGYKSELMEKAIALIHQAP